MSLLVKRASSSELVNNEPAARRPPSARKSKTGEIKSLVDRTADLLAAWGAGRFNTGDADVYTGFFTEDVIIDARGDHTGAAAFQTYHGIEGAKAWFEFIGAFEYEGLETSHVAGPADEVWLRFAAANSVSTKTGKGGAYSGYSIFTWKGDKCAKLVHVPFHPARTAAILSEEDVPVPPMAALPSFEPHPEPMQAYATMMGLWGSGELNQPEVYEMHVAGDALNDVSDSALPDVLKAYKGSASVRELMDHMSANWELTNTEVQPVAGLAPGCVTHRFTTDVKHKATGKEAKGVQCYAELGYNTDGQFVYGRNYWVNAPKLASIYVSDDSLSDA